MLQYPFPKIFGTKQGLTVVLLLRFYRVGPNRSSPRIDRGKTVWGRAGGWRLAVKLCSLLTFTISGQCVWWTGPCGSSSCRSGKWMAAAARRPVKRRFRQLIIKSRVGPVKSPVSTRPGLGRFGKRCCSVSESPLDLVSESLRV